MMTWSTALPDWERRIVGRQSLIPCDPLFPEEAAGALRAFRALQIVDAIDQPTFGEAGDQWVLDFVAVIFGAYDDISQKRLINEFFLLVSKKNGKSLISAGIMLTALIRNRRHSNELIIVAPTIKAADNSFKPAADMVRVNPKLDAVQGGFLHVQDHLRTITHLKTKATLRVLAADTSVVAGNKSAFILIDELWEFGSKPRADAMMREAAGGLVARPEGFLLSISTQPPEQPAGIFKAKLDYARGVRDGRIIDSKFLPVIYEFPRSMVDDESFLEPANFYITNPYLSRTEWGQTWIAAELEKEKAKGPETRNVFLAKHLNVEIGLNLRSDRWAGAEYWERRADPSLTLDSLIGRSDVVVVGVDGGGLDDLLGMTVLGRCGETKHWLSWSRAWAHRSVLERRKSISANQKAKQQSSRLIPSLWMDPALIWVVRPARRPQEQVSAWARTHLKPAVVVAPDVEGNASRASLCASAGTRCSSPCLRLLLNGALQPLAFHFSVPPDPTVRLATMPRVEPWTMMLNRTTAYVAARIAGFAGLSGTESASATEMPPRGCRPMSRTGRCGPTSTCSNRIRRADRRRRGDVRRGRPGSPPRPEPAPAARSENQHLEPDQQEEDRIQNLVNQGPEPEEISPELCSNHH